MIVQDTANLYNYTIYSSASSGSSISYLWDFGDTTTSALQYPTHTYIGTGPYQICLTVSDTSGCSDTFCDTIVPGMYPSATTTITVVPMGTAVPELTVNASFSIYPNPSSSGTTFQIDIDKEAETEIIVTDLLGNKAVIFKNKSMPAGRNRISWDTAEMKTGMYHVQLRTGTKTLPQKLVITR